MSCSIPDTEICDRQEADIARGSGGGFPIKLASQNIAERICCDERDGWSAADEALAFNQVYDVRNTRSTYSVLWIKLKTASFSGGYRKGSPNVAQQSYMYTLSQVLPPPLRFN